MTIRDAAQYRKGSLQPTRSKEFLAANHGDFSQLTFDTTGSLKARLKALGLSRKEHRDSSTNAEWVSLFKEARAAGWTTAEMSRVSGVSLSAVRNRLNVEDS